MAYAKNRTELLLSLINRTTPQATDNYGCTYIKDSNGGCAIGCQVSAKLAIKLEILGGDASDIMHLLPMRMQNMGEYFLMDIQSIHDDNSNYLVKPTSKTIWNNGGRKKINKLIKEYNLKIKFL